MKERVSSTHHFDFPPPSCAALRVPGSVYESGECSRDERLALHTSARSSRDGDFVSEVSIDYKYSARRPRFGKNVLAGAWEQSNAQ